MAVEQQPEVRFPQPTVDVRADLDADCFRHHARAPEPRGEKDLAESALSEHPLDAILQARFRTVDHFGRHEQVARLRSRARHVDGCGGASGGGRSGTQTRMEHSTRGAALSGPPIMKIDIVRQRLRNQKLASSGFETPADVVAWLGAVQSQDFTGAKWAIGQRARGVTDADV